MSRRIALYAVIVVLIVSLVGVSVYAILGQQSPNSLSTLTYYTEQFPPCNYQENGTVKGIAVDLLAEVTDRMGNRVTSDQVQLVKWTDAYQATLNGSNAVLFSTARLPAREESFKWAGPLFMDVYVLFAKWDSPVTITDASDLNGYKIGVIKDSAAITQLKDAGVTESSMVYFTNASAIIEQLSSGDIDLWCHAQIVGRTLTEQITGNYYSFKATYQLGDYAYYYAFSKDVPDSTVNAFQQAIDDFKQEKDAQGVSAYEKILERYIPTQGMSRTPEELVEFVETAYEYVQQNGKTAALSEFNKQTGPFIQDELYVFAYDLSGNTLALPFQPELIGTNRWNTTDTNGIAFIQQIVQTAQSGGGFVRYSYVDPDDNFAVKAKVSYVMMAGQDWLIGAGIYEAAP